jgi:hypothetical protein
VARTTKEFCAAGVKPVKTCGGIFFLDTAWSTAAISAAAAARGSMASWRFGGQMEQALRRGVWRLTPPAVVLWRHLTATAEGTDDTRHQYGWASRCSVGTSQWRDTLLEGGMHHIPWQRDGCEARGRVLGVLSDARPCLGTGPRRSGRKGGRELALVLSSRCVTRGRRPGTGCSQSAAPARVCGDRATR